MTKKPVSMSTPEHVQKGVSLIEVLVSVLVLSIGLLGVASLQAIGVKNNNSAYLRTQANVLAADILDRMRVNRTVALTGGYSVAVGSNAGGGNGVATADVTDWKASLGTLLPEGDGSVNACPAGVCTVTVQWRDGQADGSFATEIVSVVTRL